MPRTLFKDANVLDGDRPAQPGTTVVVEGNRIVEVSTQPVGVHPDDIVHDLRGYTIMPRSVRPVC
jgi:imidazolonepropionase-like amidohydrolase